MYSPTISWMAAAPRNVIMTRAEKTGVGGQSIGKIALAALAAFVAIAANIQTSTTALSQEGTSATLAVGNG